MTSIWRIRLGELDNKEMENKKMNNQTIALLALRTAQWCHMFLIQTKRFIDALDAGTGGTYPWEEDKSSVFLGDRLFFITALHHATTNLSCLYEELNQCNEDVEDLKRIIDAIVTEDMLKDIKDLRNMNEHDIDYTTGNGNAQKRFSSIVEKDNFRYQTNAHWTVLIGQAKSFTIGKIQVLEIIEKFQLQMPQIDSICKEVFEKYYSINTLE